MDALNLTEPVILFRMTTHIPIGIMGIGVHGATAVLLLRLGQRLTGASIGFNCYGVLWQTM